MRRIESFEWAVPLGLTLLLIGLFEVERRMGLTPLAHRLVQFGIVLLVDGLLFRWLSTRHSREQLAHPTRPALPHDGRLDPALSWRQDHYRAVMKMNTPRQPDEPAPWREMPP